MSESQIERRASMIDLNTKMNIRMVIEIVALTVIATAGWLSVKYELADIRRELNDITEELELINQSRWYPVSDYFFMDAFSELNNLKMPPHPGGPDAKR